MAYIIMQCCMADVYSLGYIA